MASASRIRLGLVGGMAALAAGLTGHPKSIDILQVEVTASIEQPVFLDFDFAGREMAFARTRGLAEVEH